MWEKKEIRFLLSPTLKIKDLNVKSKSLQILEENVEKCIYHQVGKDFLYKVQTYKQSNKKDIFDYRGESICNAYNKK